MKLRRTHAREARAFQLGLLLLALAACGEDEVSYQRDVQPIFAGSCVPCHHRDNPNNLVDIEDAFTPEDGLVGSINEWSELHGDFVPEFNVVPYEPDPEVSFLMEKITNPELKNADCDSEQGYCRIFDAGGFMPPAGNRLLPAQIEAIREWITLGALETVGTGPDYPPGTYSCPDQEEPQNRRTVGLVCVSRILYRNCRYCHYEGSPDPPDFGKMFDPVDGLIGKPAAFRGDINLVEPGNPNASFLVMKIEGKGPDDVGNGELAMAGEAWLPSSEIGAPMPREYEPLSEAKVEVIRQWIAAGAKND